MVGLVTSLAASVLVWCCSHDLGVGLVLDWCWTDVDQMLDRCLRCRLCCWRHAKAVLVWTSCSRCQVFTLGQLTHQHHTSTGEVQVRCKRCMVYDNQTKFSVGEESQRWCPRYAGVVLVRCFWGSGKVLVKAVHQCL